MQPASDRFLPGLSCSMKTPVVWTACSNLTLTVLSLSSYLLDTTLVAQVSQHYPVKVIEKDSGLMTTDIVSINAGFMNSQARRWIVLPGGFLATYQGLRMTLTVLVTEPEPGKTTVNLRTHYEAFEDNVSHAWVVCESNGSLENDLLREIALQIPVPATANEPPTAK